MKNEQKIEIFDTEVFEDFKTTIRKDEIDEAKKHCIDVFSIDFDTISNVDDDKIERFNRMIDLNVVANKIDNTCVTNDFFSISHTKLIALIER